MESLIALSFYDRYYFCVHIRRAISHCHMKYAETVRSWFIWKKSGPGYDKHTNKYGSNLSKTKEILKFELKAFVILLIKCRNFFWNTR